MKKIIFQSVLLVFAGFTIQAQSNDNGKEFPQTPPPGRTATEADAAFSSRGMSPSTALLLLDIRKRQKSPDAISEAYLVEKYSLKKKGNTLYVNSFIVGTEQFSTDELRPLGVIAGSKSGNIRTALIPIDKISELAALPNIKYLEIGGKASLYMDSARSATRVDKVHEGMSPLAMPYSGKDVVVGMMDIGLDFTHPNFYDSTGTANYRIKRAWMQMNNSGFPPNGYAYGTELTTQSAMTGTGTDNPFADHGSHTTGIAAGAGGYPNSPYKGVAYESDIVFVGADISCEPCIADGIHYIQEYAASVGKPSVINMSFGSNHGTHDGTSAICQFTDSANGPGKLLVGSAGNSGVQPLYLENHFLQSNTVAQTFISFAEADYVSNGWGALFICGEPFDNFTARVALFNTVTNSVEDITPIAIPGGMSLAYSDTMWGSNGAPAFIDFASSVDPFSNKPTMTIDVDNSFQPDGIRKLGLVIFANNTITRTWGVTRDIYFSSNNFTGNVYAGATDHNVGDMACGNGVISVGAYTSRDSWLALNNSQQGLIPYQTLSAVGDIAPFSSEGPTADGRTKPDITAPGNILISSVNSFSPAFHPLANRTAKSVTIGADTWFYGAMEGTSMSAPMVTGILALWLQQNPNLTKDEAIAMMKATAITDNFTGTIPANGSNTWGWGKINAFQGLVSVSVENIPENFAMKVYPNPATTQLNIAFDNKVSTGLIVIYDITGKVVFIKETNNVSPGHIETINTGALASGSYTLKVSTDNKHGSYKIVKQ